MGAGGLVVHAHPTGIGRLVLGRINADRSGQAPIEEFDISGGGTFEFARQYPQNAC